MTTKSERDTVGVANQNADASATRRMRFAAPVTLLVLYWGGFLAINSFNLAIFQTFLYRLEATLALLATFAAWWLFNRGVSWGEKFLMPVVAAVGLAAALALRSPELETKPIVSLIMFILAASITAATIWMFLTRNASPASRRRGLIAIALLMWAPLALLRTSGMSGGALPEIHWRWTPSGEEEFLAAREAAKQGGADNAQPAKAAEVKPLVAAENDWTDYRGPRRDAVLNGVKLDADWDRSPPKELWRHHIGPGWSSITVVGDYLFTQEQRGDMEAVVALDANTGDEIWSHEDKTRFSEELGGDGPRATPTFAEGQLYTLGATGVLNCFEAADGKLVWSRNIADDSGAKIPEWGFTSSPLVVDGRVIVFAGGPDDRSLLAYDSQDGQPAWNLASGGHSYSSPQLATFGGVQQVVYLSDKEFTAADPATGKKIWGFPAGQVRTGMPATQPNLIGPNEVMIAFTEAGGTMLLELQPGGEGQEWKVDPKWQSRDLKPYFNDYVRYGDAVYGFDGNIFASIDVKTGKRHWKKGRYGAGQVLLLADQGVLLVLSEQGEAILVEANPAELKEVARFPVLEGKTWNHPAIVGDRLYVRNAEEIASYKLKLQ
ncbi:PQQ-binding-like beta-propeller repeat protein [Lacipirellula limnantheis]|uniref:Outer membrane biogenesis protein BamB n=1 Tax=Lacipirellula limnantheis TaxID=2528024 RepID=A0A517U3F0_9BACT|nr:PQQ-binding-like beta-propeller repeat protein [Lacipirellula limnantheis]QDT75149.1 outer membrane biogenesis protein BamB [Lacipirellula limnantheis]